MLRRFSWAATPLPPPTPPVADGLLVWLREPENTGITWTDSVRLVGRMEVRVSVAIAVTGVGLLLPLLMTRDPVTTTSSTRETVSAWAAGAPVWA